MNRAALLTVIPALLILGNAQRTPAQEKRNPKELAALSDKAFDAAANGQLNEAIKIWEDILDEFETEDARLDIHVNLTVAYRKLKKLPEAWHHLTKYLKGKKQEDRKAGKELQTLEDKLAATHVKMAVACDPSDSTIYLAGEATGTAYSCPLTWWFEPGEHPVHVARRGYRARTAGLSVVRRGGEAVYTVHLKPLPKYGTLVIEGSKKAVTVFINGMIEGKVPFRRKLEVGTYDLMVGRAGEPQWTKKVVIREGETTVEKPALAQETAEKTPKPIAPPVEKREGKHAKGQQPEIWKWLLLGGGLAVAGAGGILQYVGYSNNQNLRETYPADQSLSEEQFDYNEQSYKSGYSEDVAPMKTASFVLYGLGGAAAATGAVLLVLDALDSGRGARPASITPLPVGNGCGMAIEWTF